MLRRIIKEETGSVGGGVAILGRMPRAGPTMDRYRESIRDRGKSEYKDPELAVHLLSLRNREEVFEMELGKAERL